MVYYIRFLKPPRVSRLHVDRDDALVSTMITITTDLGDAFYPGNLCIHTAIDYEGVMTSLALSKWEPGMRVLKIEARTLVNNPRSRSKFFFTANKSLGIDSLQLDRIPDIVSAWTEEFSQWDDLDTNVTLRRFQLPCSQVLEICEENGESMARHIWYVVSSSLFPHGKLNTKGRWCRAGSMVDQLHDNNGTAPGRLTVQHPRTGHRLRHCWPSFR